MKVFEAKRMKVFEALDGEGLAHSRRKPPALRLERSSNAVLMRGGKSRVGVCAQVYKVTFRKHPLPDSR